MDLYLYKDDKEIMYWRRNYAIKYWFISFANKISDTRYRIKGKELKKLLDTLKIAKDSLESYFEYNETLETYTQIEDIPTEVEIYLLNLFPEPYGGIMILFDEWFYGETIKAIKFLNLYKVKDDEEYIFEIDE